jgi:hypothetical protein
MRSDFTPRRIKEAKEILSRQLQIVKEEIVQQKHDAVPAKITLWQRLLRRFRQFW